MVRRLLYTIAAFSAAAVWSCIPLTAVAAAPDEEKAATLAEDPDDDAHLPLNGEEADDLDALLDLADKDFSQVARVDVSAPSLNTEVTTVSRKKSTVGRSPAAVFVISQDMIRRSGATSIPEVLRMAPGVQVARISSHQWAVSIRGFNGLYSNRLQVQIDGRSVYTPLFGGVFWSIQNIPLADIQRIEVVRGPGGTVWGANAVNGIINVITKDAEATQGMLLQGGGGTMERGFGTVRYGTQLGEGTHARFYGSWFDRNHGVTGSHKANDDWDFGRTGFRIDSQIDPDNKMTFLGDYYDGTTGLTNTLPVIAGPPFSETLNGTDDYRGGDLLFRWEHRFSADSNSALQFYYDRAEFDVDFTVPGRGLASRINVIDIDFQHQHQLDDRHSIVWGAGYQDVCSKFVNSPDFIEVTRPERGFQRLSGFIQDEITIRPEEAFFTLGAKVSDNTFSGVEVQPTARILWLPDDRHSVWASVSRAVRVPTITDMDGILTLNPISTSPFPVFPRQVPGSIGGQDVVSYEIGIRGQPTDELSWDLATFISRYDNLGDGPIISMPTPPGDPFIVQARGKGGSAESYGAELSTTLQATSWMKLMGNYTFIEIFGTDADTAAAPLHQLYLQSSMDLSKTVEGDITWRYVDSVPTIANQYNTLDLRLAWKPFAGFEWAVVARNLLDHGHREFSPTVVGDVITGVPTEVYSVITWTY